MIRKIFFLILIFFVIIYKFYTEPVKNLKIMNSIPVFNGKRISTSLTFENINKDTDLFILDLKVDPKLCKARNKINYKLKIKTPFSSNMIYWDTQVILPEDKLKIDLDLELDNLDEAGNVVSIDVKYIPYGTNQDNTKYKYYQIVVPIESDIFIKNQQKKINWRSIDNVGKLLSIKTPILTEIKN